MVKYWVAVGKDLSQNPNTANESISSGVSFVYSGSQRFIYCSTSFFYSFCSLLASPSHHKKKKNRAGRRLRKQKSPWTTQIKDEELLLIKHGWNHSHVHGKVRECECLWRACTQGSIIFGDTGLPKIMQQKEKCLENKRLVLFWAKATLSSLESTNGAKKESVDYFAIRSRPHGYAASWGWTSGI